MPLSPPIGLRVADGDDLRWVEEAVRTCPLAMAEFGGFYTEASQRLPLMADGGRELLVITRGATRIGFIDTDADVPPDWCATPGDAVGDVLGLAWFVVPAARGEHVTVTALQLVRQRWSGWGLMAAIDPRNGPSLAVARRAGFVDRGPNAWGERVLVLA